MISEPQWTAPDDRRSRRISEVCELTIQVMRLRPPQAEALRRIARLLQRLPRPLAECSHTERQTFLAEAGRHAHTAHPTFTIALATGVGKTRLAGAIIALLYLARESSTFLILAPRRAVLRRFQDALNPHFREYIFVEPGLVPEPNVITSDLVGGAEGVGAATDMFRTGPTIYLLSPQLISTSDRFRGRQQFTGKSPLEHLHGKKDLVVLVDEAHHVGGLGKAEAARWTEAIRELAPAIQVGLTATPRQEEGENILYEYPLAQALAEQLYVKDVHLLVRNFDSDLLAPEEVDQATITYALNRLQSKEEAVSGVSTPPFPKVKPVLVFFARDIEHAKWVTASLEDRHGLMSEEILLTHSRASKKEEEIERLLGIEDIKNPVRVVVNVQELTEGWDVRNVYVVAPLRAMATFQGALQAMGRGLRLPAGTRAGQPEADSLDVVCFGKHSLREIVEDATSWLGASGQDGAPGILIDDSEAEPLQLHTVTIPCRTTVDALVFSDLELVHEDVSLAISPEAISRNARMAVEELDLARLRARFAADRVVSIDRGAFIHAAATRVLRAAARYLSDDLHYQEISSIIERWLVSTELDGESVEFDPAQVGEEVGRIIVDGARRRTLQYQATGLTTSVAFGDIDRSIVSSNDGGAPPAAEGHMVTESEFRPGMFVSGCSSRAWQNSLHAGYEFDSWPEVRAAWLLDLSDDVDWWVRNEPRRLRIPTPAGLFSPDFLARLSSGEILLLEVKGSMYWEPPESEPRIKARSASLWAEAQAEAGFGPIIFGVALDSDVQQADTLASLRERFADGYSGS